MMIVRLNERTLLHVVQWHTSWTQKKSKATRTREGDRPVPAESYQATANSDSPGVSGVGECVLPGAPWLHQLGEDCEVRGGHRDLSYREGGIGPGEGCGVLLCSAQQSGVRNLLLCSNAVTVVQTRWKVS